MTATTPVLMIIFIFAFLPLILAEFARNKALPTLGNFFLQDRKMSLAMVFFTVYATWVSSFAFLGSSSSFYFNGPVYLTAFAWNALFGLLFMVIGKRLWFHGKRNGYITPTDFFNDIYGSKALNLLITIVMLIFTIPYLQIQLSSGAFLIEIASGGLIPWRISGLLFYLIIIIYLWAGGLRAVALADIFYGSLIFASMLVVGFFMINKAGGVEYVFNNVMERDLYNVVLSHENNESRVLSWLAMFLVIPLGAIMGPPLWLRAYAVGERKTFDIMPLLLTFASIMYLGSILSGTSGILLAPNMSHSDTIIPYMLVKYLSGPLAAILFCGIASASLSTANSQIHAISAIYTIDIHKRYINSSISEKRLVYIAKWAVLFFSAFAFLLLIRSPALIVDTGTIAMGGTAQVFIPTIGALFWAKSNGKAAIAGILGGLFTLLFLRFFLEITASFCGVLGLFINCLIFIIGSYIQKDDTEVKKRITAYMRAYNSNL